MTTTTGTEAETIILEDGKEVYPCRCGDMHRGDYAFYDYMHHNCFHDEPLVDITTHRSDTRNPTWMCPICGKVWATQGWEGYTEEVNP